MISLLMKTYYEILNLADDASGDEIKANYRQLAKQYHPDHNQAKDAESQFKTINQAYEILSDPTKRNNYDYYLKIIATLGDQVALNYPDLQSFNESYDYQDVWNSASAANQNGTKTDQQIPKRFFKHQFYQPPKHSWKKSAIAIVIVVVAIVIIFNLAYKIKF